MEDSLICKDSVSLTECFELQLSEVEMLNSMYPNSDEFSVSLPLILKDMNKYLTGESHRVPDQIDLTLNLTIPDFKDKVEVAVCLPHEYPFSKPEVSARSISLNRSQHRHLNSAIVDFLQTLPDGELCILSIINWLTEYFDQYISLDNQACSESVDSKDDLKSDLTVCRLWIYSHHIYSKFKRRDIIDLGDDFKLTGFSLPGKPGFICIEGYKKDCYSFLQSLKQMCWKKISLVREEIKKGNNLNKFRKFENFSEVCFEVRKGSAREYHMDMGQFLKYLTEHDCAYAFQDLTGLEGQISVDK